MRVEFTRSMSSGICGASSWTWRWVDTEARRKVTRPIQGGSSVRDRNGRSLSRGDAMESLDLGTDHERLDPKSYRNHRNGHHRTQVAHKYSSGSPWHARSRSRQVREVV